MTAALVSHASVVGTAATSGSFTTPAINTISATLLIVSVNSYGMTYTVSDSASNTWNALTTNGGAADAYQTIYYAANAKTAVSHTFSVTVSAACYPYIDAAAFKGVQPGSPLQSQTGANTAVSSTTLQTGSLSPVGAGCLILSGMACYNPTTGALSIDSGLAITDQALAVGGVNYGGALAWLAQTAAAAINPTWTISAASTALATTLAVFTGATAWPTAAVTFR